MTEAPFNPKENRERLAQVMFETFGVQSLQVSMSGVCALYASGRTTGVVLDCGDGVSHTVPIYEGFAIPNAIQKIFLAGRDLTEYLTEILRDKGLKFSTPAEMEIVRDIKETMCFIVPDFDAAMKEAKGTHDKDYVLPDGRKIVIGNERFRCGEVLFSPGVVRPEMEGIHKYCFDSVMKCDNDVRRDLF